MPEIGFRLATDKDWPAIYPIFMAVTETEDTYPYLSGLSDVDARDIWMASTNTVFVATEDDAIVGTAYIKANMTGLGSHVANGGWMIDPKRQGGGIGRRFAEYVIDQAGRFGYTAMQFNAVVVTNTGAIALWESLGFSIVGTVPDAFRHSINGMTAVHIMYREL